VVRTPTASTAPPYAPTEVVKAVTPPKPGTKKKPPPPSPTPPTSSATAKPGDVLLMSTRLKGKPVGPPQPVTITINQGPGNSLSVTAAVAGGQTSTATVTGAHGKKITLVTPRFGCTVPPQPTICPPSNVQARSHQYKLTFMASPYTRAIAISALIQGS
jgi:hypothetical protein